MIYSLGLFLYFVAASPFYALRVLRGRYRSSYSQRLGRNISRVTGKTLWIHACSVGEVEAAAPLVEIIRRELPGIRLIVSTVTETGQARANALFPFAQVRYLPFDFKFCVRRHLDSAEDLIAFIIMETELWPNLINELADRKIPVYVSNGRISDRTWPRYRMLAPFFQSIMRKVTAVAARTEVDADRFRELGAQCVAAVGNIKFDRAPGAAPRDVPEGRFVIFGSTHPGEEEICLDAFRDLKKDFPSLRAIIAPRHIERAKSISGAPRSAGWKNEDVLVLDSHGELGGMYQIADVAFIGGSFVPVGGHNPIEAAIHGVPVLWGPHVSNFRDACALLAGRGGFRVENRDELLQTMKQLLSDEELRRTAGAHGREAVIENQGAAARNWKVFRIR